MLGDKIGQASGKVTSRRVLSNPGGGPKMETSFEARGTILGIEETETGTYWAVVRPDGSVYGEGQGVVMGKGEMGTWVGQGVGSIKEDGGVTYRGGVYFQSTTPKWSRLNRIAVVYEFDVDAQGNSRTELWEWK